MSRRRKKQLLELPWGTLVDAQKVDAIDVVDLTPAITLLPAGKSAKPRGSHVVAVHSLGKVFMSLPLEADDARALRREVGRLVNRERGELNLMPPEAPKPEAMRNAVVDLLRLRPNESVEGITALLGLEQTLIRATLRALLEAGVIERRPFAYGPGYRLTP